jgi:hypothetical protein
MGCAKQSYQVLLFTMMGAPVSLTSWPLTRHSVACRERKGSARERRELVSDGVRFGIHACSQLSVIE